MLKLFPLLLCLFLTIPLHAQESHPAPLQWGLGLSGSLHRARYSAFYDLNPDLALEVFARQLGGVIDGDWQRAEKSFGVATQLFVKNAWNVRLGVLSRQTVLTNTYFSQDNATDSWHHTFDLVVRQRDVAAEAAIGTQWQWSSFYCGLDWINYEYRVYRASSSAALVVKDSSRIRMNYAESKVEGARVADNDLNKANIYVSARMGWSF